ncbi:hypothetical protein [Streptomyces sp. NPDC021020]|uniref:hypothetical protein n=1 Tax=Streptomyces sp. NPDC021020 TaxID=3365109 RepID=UPI003791EBC7
MTEATTPAPESTSPVEEVPDAIAQALTAQGHEGELALALFRDARRILGDTTLECPAQVAAACVRGAIESLLYLAKEPNAFGIKAAAKDVISAVSAQLNADPASLPQHTAELLTAVDALQKEVDRPGGQRRRQAMRIAERLTGQQLGPGQEEAVDVWGQLYNNTSALIHGQGDGAQTRRCADLYRQALAAVREVFVPLTARAQRVLELTALATPTAEDAAEVNGWADPRAMAYFFQAQPHAAWLDLLDEIWLLPDPGTGTWPAWPYLWHLTTEDPAAAAAWLCPRVARVTACGPDAQASWLSLAGRIGAVLNTETADLVESLLARPDTPGRLLAVAADWALTVRLPDRDRSWILTVEKLIKHAIAGHRDVQDIHLWSAHDTTLHFDDREQVIKQIHDLQLPDHQGGQLLKALVRSAYRPADDGALQPHPDVRLLRTVTGILLAHEIAATDPESRPIRFHQALFDVRLDDTAPSLGPRLARALLDLAAADARAGVPLAERTKMWTAKLAPADAALHNRILAAHLVECRTMDEQHAPARDGDWWQAALDLVPRAVTERPPTENAQLVEIVLRTCPAQDVEVLHGSVAAALGPAPTAAELADGRAALVADERPPASWLTAWDWSPVLPAEILAPWSDVLATLRSIAPAGPRDPRQAEDFVTISAAPQPALTVEDLAATAAVDGPAAAARQLTAATDAADGRPYFLTLRQLVQADPAAWTADPSAITQALGNPALATVYLSAAAEAHRAPGVLPGGAVVSAAAATLTTLQALAAADAEVGLRQNSEHTLIDLLNIAWDRGHTDSTELAPALTHLRERTDTLTQPPATGPSQDTPAALDPVARALNCLLNHASHHHTITGTLPNGILDLLHEVLTATGTDERTAYALAPHLPFLHSAAAQWVRDHADTLLTLPAGQPSPAAAWLHWGPAHAPLLADLDRPQLLQHLRVTGGSSLTHTALALLDDPAQLGDTRAFFTDLASHPCGPTAVALLLELTAVQQQRTAASATWPGRALDLWRQALAADLPAGSMAGAGAFATDTGLDTTDWLPLTLASAQHSPQLRHAVEVAERAARLPHVPAAFSLMAILVAHPADPYDDREIRDHARALLTAATASLGGHSQITELREALVNAGDITADLIR